MEKIISAEKAINDKAKALMNDNAHKIQYTDEHGVQKTLQDIRKDEEVAQQKLNAAIQAEANVAINGTQAEKAAARAAVNNARNEFTTAHGHTVKVEKMIKTAIKRGTDYSNPNNSEAIKMRDSVGAANLQDVTSLYNESKSCPHTYLNSGLFRPIMNSPLPFLIALVYSNIKYPFSE
mgnify:CR=1 FL=1